MSEWADVGPVAEVRRRRKVVIPAGDAATGEAPDTVLVLAVDDGFRAFGNVCVHRRKLLERGVILTGRLICPGHQWAFDLDDGWEATMQRCQPMYDVRIDVRPGAGGDAVEVPVEVVQVDLASRTLRHPEADPESDPESD